MSCVDFSVLEQFCELLGEDGRNETKELIDLYLTDAPEQLQMMQEGLLSDNMETFKRAAHSFKSSSANIGAFDLQALCQVMENQASTGEIASLEKELTTAKSQFEKVKAELSTWRNQAC